MAHDAAIRMSRDIYDGKINDATEALKRCADECIRNVVPMPVRQVLEEYKQYFSYTNNVVIALGNLTVPAQSTIKVPTSFYYINVSKESYFQCKKLYDELLRFKNRKSDFIEETTNTLYRELKYEKRVAEVLPEALSYIKFPEVVAPPARTLYYEQLNRVLSNIKKDKK